VKKGNLFMRPQQGFRQDFQFGWGVKDPKGVVGILNGFYRFFTIYFFLSWGIG